MSEDSEIPYVHGNEYYADLKEFRDQALVESNWIGERKRMGIFTYGIAHASWHSEDGSSIHLVEKGLRIGDSPMKLYPTTLRVTDTSEELEGIEVITYRMDLDDVGVIEMFRNMFYKASMKEAVKSEMSRRTERKHGLEQLSDEDRVFLYCELQRGATGLC